MGAEETSERDKTKKKSGPKSTWSEKEIELLKEKYKQLGPKIIQLLLNNKKCGNIRGTAFKLKLKFKKKRQTFCKNCGKQTFGSNGYCAYSSISGLCNSCHSKANYKKRGIFTNHHGKLWSEEELNILKKLYYNSKRKRMVGKLKRNWSSIVHKAHRLGLKRNPKFFEEVHEKNLNRWRQNNPMHNLKFKNKAWDKLRELYEKNPKLLLNHRLRRNKKTFIEEEIERILVHSFNLKIDKDFFYNQYFKTNKGFKFPDFIIPTKKLIIECDGSFWHKNKEKDFIRDNLFKEKGYKVLHFSEKDIKKRVEVIKFIQQELQQSNKIVEGL